MASIEVYSNYYDGNKDELVKAVYRDAVHKRTADTNKAFGGNIKGHPDVLTTTNNSINNYHVVDEIQQLALSIVETTGYQIYNCWANINKSGYWLGPHNHDREQIKYVAIYYLQIDDNETLDFNETEIELQQNMLVAFDSKTLHSFKPKERSKDKIVISFELI